LRGKRRSLHEERLGASPPRSFVMGTIDDAAVPKKERPTEWFNLWAIRETAHQVNYAEETLKREIEEPALRGKS